jgi:3-oxoacyl-[acyl-carrier protein] reductase
MTAPAKPDRARLEGRVALVTGAASGMGRSTAHLFADQGARVGVLDLDSQRVAAVVGEIEGAGGVAAGFAVDVADAARVRVLPAELAERLGPLDILVNNAGVLRGGAIEDPDYESMWDFTLRVNLEAQVRLIRAFLPQLLRERAGRIINVASTEGLGATAGASPYTVSKHGVVGLTRALAVELGARGVTVNCICPGPIRTGMTDVIPEDMKTRFARRRVPLRRYGDPEEVAHMTLSLALPAASYVHGAIIPVDGGLLVQNT